MKHYYVYDFIKGHPIVIDTKEKTITFYHANIYGQIYDLEKGGEKKKISAAKINGLIKRLNGSNYSFKNSYVIDWFIYTFIMTEEQRAKCNQAPTNYNEKDLLGSSDELATVLRLMCEKTYEQEYSWSAESKERDREKHLAYCYSYLKKLDPYREVNAFLAGEKISK